MSGFFDTGSDTSTTATRERRSIFSVGQTGAAGDVIPEEVDRVSSIQRQLALETRFRDRGYGLRSLLGSLGGGRTSLLGSG